VVSVALWAKGAWTEGAGTEFDGDLLRFDGQRGPSPKAVAVGRWIMTTQHTDGMNGLALLPSVKETSLIGLDGLLRDRWVAAPGFSQPSMYEEDEEEFEEDEDVFGDDDEFAEDEGAEEEEEDFLEDEEEGDLDTDAEEADDDDDDY